MRPRFACAITGKHEGFLLIEILVGVAIFILFLTGLGTTMLYGQEATVAGGDRMRAAYLTERTLEAARSIRDSGFANVTTGTHGVWVNHSGVWAYSGSQVTLSGSYVTNVKVGSLASDWLVMTGSTSWNHGYNRTGTAMLVTELTNWQTTSSIGNWSSVTLEGSYIDGSAPLFNRIAVSGNTAYVANNSTNGVYVLDISNTASPAHVGSINTGYAAVDVAVREKRLYVLTLDPNAELKVYSIVNPQSPAYVTSADLPSSALGTSLALGRNDLYVTASNPPVGQHVLFAYDVTNSGALTLQGTPLNDSDTMNMIALSGTSAYIASALDTSELRVVNASYTGSLALVGGYNLSGTLDGTAIAVTGTSAILGTQKNTGGQEMVMFDVGTGGVPSSNGPWYHEASGSVVGIAIDPFQCYAFLGVSSGHKAFQVVDIRNKSSLPQLFSYDSSYGLGRGLAYDLVRDRIYLMTDSAVLIFKPSSVGGTCP